MQTHEHKITLTQTQKNGKFVQPIQYIRRETRLMSWSGWWVFRSSMNRIIHLYSHTQNSKPATRCLPETYPSGYTILSCISCANITNHMVSRFPHFDLDAPVFKLNFRAGFRNVSFFIEVAIFLHQTRDA